jgi:hypothetical protein
MTKRQLLENYREIVIDIEGMDKRIAFLSRYIGGPRPVRSPQYTGMPRGTNDPEAAMLQREDMDVDRILQKISVQMEESRQLMDAFEHILDETERTDGKRMKNIIQYYYGLGYSEEKVAEKEDISQTHVNRLRNEYIKKYGDDLIHG